MSQCSHFQVSTTLASDELVDRGVHEQRADQESDGGDRCQRIGFVPEHDDRDDHPRDAGDEEHPPREIDHRACPAPRFHLLHGIPLFVRDDRPAVLRDSAPEASLGPTPNGEPREGRPA